MCRGITDAGLGGLVDACPRLRRLVLWGDSQISGLFYLGHARTGQAAADGGVQLRIYGRAGDVMAAPDDNTAQRDFAGEGLAC